MLKQVAMSMLAKQIRGVSYKPTDLHDTLDSESVILLRANNIGDGLINFDDVVYVDKSKVSSEQYLRKGDILICASSGSKTLVGKAAQIQFDGEYTFGAFCKVVRPIQISPDFLGMYFQSPSYRCLISNLAQGANINNIKNEHIDTLLVNTYDESTQNKFTSILNKVVSIIRARRQQLTELDTLVKARFVEMFGDPIDNPLGWPVRRLSEICVLITNGNTPQGGSSNYVDRGILFLRSQNVWRNRIELDDVAYIDEATHKSMKKSSLHNRDILITKTGRINTENSSLGRSALFTGEDDSANINGHVYLVRIRDSALPEFVVQVLTGEPYRKYIRKVCVGGIDKRQINLDQVEGFPIIIPPMDIQREYTDFAAQVDKSKSLVQKALEEAQTLFDSLMQQYFG